MSSAAYFGSLLKFRSRSSYLKYFRATSFSRRALRETLQTILKRTTVAYTPAEEPTPHEGVYNQYYQSQN